MACAICEKHRPRRFCPGERGDICTLCCGTERETSVDCPLDCEYLQDAHLHERCPALDPETVPNRDIRLTGQFLEDNAALVAISGGALFDAAARTPGVFDSDVRQALEALVRTYRTLQSGVYYQTRPDNLLAGNICALVGEALDGYRRDERERGGVSRTRDADVLGVLVFLQRLEYDRSNGRPRGRAFLDFLRRTFVTPAAGPPSGLLVP